MTDPTLVPTHGDERMHPDVALVGQDAIERPAHGGPRRKPAPPAFAEVFTRVGWRGVEAAYGSRTGCNRRWIDDCGGDDLFAARRDYLQRLRDLRRARAA